MYLWWIRCWRRSAWVSRKVIFLENMKSFEEARHFWECLSWNEIKWKLLNPKLMLSDSPGSFWTKSSNSLGIVILKTSLNDPDSMSFASDFSWSHLKISYCLPVICSNVVPSFDSSCFFIWLSWPELYKNYRWSTLYWAWFLLFWKRLHLNGLDLV